MLKMMLILVIDTLVEIMFMSYRLKKNATEKSVKYDFIFNVKSPFMFFSFFLNNITVTGIKMLTENIFFYKNLQKKCIYYKCNRFPLCESCLSSNSFCV